MQNLEDQLQLAISYIESGQYEEGLQKTKDVLKNADDELSYTIAQLYLEWGMSEDAYDLLKKMYRQHPGNSELILALAEAAVDLDFEDEAIDYLTRIHKLDDNYLSAQVLLADLYQSQGLEEAAEHRLLQARAHAPKEPILTFALAEFYASTGKVVEAIDLYKHVLHAEVLSHENIPLKLAEVLSLRGQFEEALIYYDKGVEKGSTLDGLFGYAVTAIQAGKFQTAITQLEKLKELDPHYSSLYSLLADAYEEEGAMEEAIQVLNEGLNVDQHNERLYFKLAKAYLATGEMENAIFPLKRILAADSEHIEAMKLLVEIYRELQDPEAVIQLVEQQESFEDPELTWYYANALKEEDLIEKAFPVYQSISSYFIEDADFLSEYGELAWEMGQTKVAKEMLQKAYTLNQDLTLLEFIERIETQDDTF